MPHITEVSLRQHSVPPEIYLLDFGRPLPNHRLLRSPCDYSWNFGIEIELGDWLLVRTDETSTESPLGKTIKSNNTITAQWKETPTHENMFGMSQHESSEYLRKLSAIRKNDRKWLPSDFSEQLKMQPRDGYLLVQAAKECGYKEGIYYFDQWLLNHLGKWLSMAPQLEQKDFSIIPNDRSKVASSIGRFPIYYDMVETGDWEGEQFLYVPHVNYDKVEEFIDPPGVRLRSG